MNWCCARPVIDSPLTIVYGNGAVALKEQEDVADALLCKECADGFKEEPR